MKLKSVRKRGLNISFFFFYFLLKFNLAKKSLANPSQKNHGLLFLLQTILHILFQLKNKHKIVLQSLEKGTVLGYSEWV